MGLGTDAGGDTLTFEWDLDSDGNFGESGASATRGDETVAEPVFFVPAGMGTFTAPVGLRVRDDDGGRSAVSTTLVSFTGNGQFVPLASPLKSLGEKSHLVIRATTLDVSFAPGAFPDADVRAKLQELDDYTRFRSYGKTSYPRSKVALVPGVMTVPFNLIDINDAYKFHIEAQKLAQALDPANDPAKFDFVTVIHPVLSASGFGYGGVSMGRLMNMHNNINVGVWAHEFAHSLGLGFHADYLDPLDPTAVVSDFADATLNEYGNRFDVEGCCVAHPQLDWGSFFKTRLNWWSLDNVEHVVNNGTYRIHALDEGNLQPDRLYGLQLVRNEVQEYWLEHRTIWSDPKAADVLFLNIRHPQATGFQRGGGSTQAPMLLDATPGSIASSDNDRLDGQLALGRTYHDPEARLFVTPIARHTEPGNDFMDVVVNQGDFPLNEPPVVTLTASSLNVLAGADVMLSATVADPNGDATGVFWNFADGTTASQVTQTTHRWAAPGQYPVRLLVSDMKGGLAELTTVIVVNQGGAIVAPLSALDKTVNTRTTDEQTAADVASNRGAGLQPADADRFVVVWQSANQDGGGAGIFGRRFDSTGSPLGGEFPINTTTAGDQRQPDVAMDAAGNFVVVWQGPGSNATDVFARAFDNQGNPRGGEFQVNTDNFASQLNPKVAMDASSGDFVVVWTSNVTNNNVRFRRFRADGSAKDAFELTAPAGKHFSNVDVAVAPNGGFVVVWDNDTREEPGADADEFGVFGQRYRADGTADGNVFQANVATDGSQFDPQVAFSPDGSFSIAWDSDTNRGPIQLEALTPEDTAITPEINFPANSGNPFAGLAGADVGSDHLAALWTGKIEITQAGTYSFYTTSDDGSVLSIDGRRVVDDNFHQGMRERSGNITLTAGQHDIQVAFYEHGGGAGVEARYELPGTTPKQIIPRSVLLNDVANPGTFVAGGLKGQFFRLANNGVPNTVAARLALLRSVGQGVFLRNFSGGSGTPVATSGEIRASSPYAKDETAPALAIAADGTRVVAWRVGLAGSLGGSTGNGNIGHRLFAADGTALNADQITPLGTNFFQGPDIATLGGPAAYVLVTPENVSNNVDVRATFVAATRPTIDANADTAGSEIGQPVAINVLANDINPSAAPPSLAIHLAPTAGTAEVMNNGTPADSSDDFIRYTPAAGFFGTASFVYAAVDSQGTPSLAAVTVFVDGSRNRAPFDINADALVLGDGVRSGDLVANLTALDVDPTFPGSPQIVFGGATFLLVDDPSGLFTLDGSRLKLASVNQSSVPLARRTPDATVITPTIEFPNSGGNPFATLSGLDVGEDNLGALWRGKIEIMQAGVYSFFTTSDDGSVLFVDGRRIVDNNFFQGMTERSGRIFLAAGQHDILLGFVEGGGGAGVEARYELPGAIAKQIIPSNVLLNDVATPGTFVSGGLRGDFFRLTNSTFTERGLNLLDQLRSPLDPGQIHEVTVRATDAGGLSHDKTFQFTVVDTPGNGLFDVDALGSSGVGTAFRGAAASEFSAQSVAAGDVNGDGFDDLIVGSLVAEPGGLSIAGSVYVVFGSSAGVPSSLSGADLDGANGFVINGLAAEDLLGHDVDSADVNGDGVDDLIVGAPGTASQGGQVYVVFGRTAGFSQSAQFDLATLDGQNGFVIRAMPPNNGVIGRSVGHADINGDGADEVLTGSETVWGCRPDSCDQVFVIYGRGPGAATPFPAVVSSQAGGAGFAIITHDPTNSAPQNGLGKVASTPADVNGDGLDDLILSRRPSFQEGAAFVGFGSATPFPDTFRLSSFNGSNGFEIVGTAGVDFAFSAEGLGDTNGDGVDDLAIGVLRANSDRGQAHVVFGRQTAFPARLDVATLNGGNGFTITNTIGPAVRLGHAASGGDFNGDGLADVVIGGPETSLQSQAVVVFGSASPRAATLDVAGLDGQNGFVASSGHWYSAFGFAVSLTGDLNGDGRSDLIVGSPNDELNNEYESGVTYVIHGGEYVGNPRLFGGSGGTGSTGDDEFGGTFGSQSIFAGPGNDMLSGGGGPDVLNAGPGDDQIVVTDLSFTEVSGGPGIDTLKLDNRDLVLDLTQATNVSGIEVIDIIGRSPNTLILDPESVARVSDTNTLTVIRDDDDTVVIGDGWDPIGTETIDGRVLNTFTTSGGDLMLHVVKIGGDFTADAGGPYMVAEGGSVNVVGTLRVPSASPTTFTWDLDGDGRFSETGGAAQRGDETGATPTFSAAGLDGPTTVTVSLRAIDANLNFARATATINVSNANPTASSGGPYSALAGSAVQLIATSSDAGGGADPLTFAWDLDGDSSFGETGGAAGRGDETVATPLFDTTGLPAGDTTVRLRVADDDGGSVTQNVTITVQVRPAGAPVADGGGPYSVLEGSTVVLSAANTTDPDDAVENLTYAWDLDGDGVFGETGTAAEHGDESGPNPNFDAAGLDGPSTRFVTLRVSDPTGQTDAVPATVRIGNASPSASTGGEYTVAEGASLTLAGMATDPAGGADPLTFLWDLDNDGVFGETSGAGLFGDETGPQPTFIALADGPAASVVRLQVEDEDGGVSPIQSTLVRVANAAPIAFAGELYVVREGGASTLSGVGEDSDGDALSFEWDLDGDGVFGETGQSAERGDELGATPEFSAAGLDDGPVPVSLRVRDDDGLLSAVSTATVLVVNEAPTADPGEGYLVNRGNNITLSGTAFDPAGDLDSLTFEWDLDDDGVFGETGPDAEHGDELGPNPMFVLPSDADRDEGTHGYRVHLRVRDDDGGLSDEVTTEIETNDKGPFVEAGGDYLVFAGRSVSLQASATFVGATGDDFQFTWDLDGDGVFGESRDNASRGDETGATPTFTADSMAGDATLTVTVRVAISPFGITADDLATIHVVGLPTVEFSAALYETREGAGDRMISSTARLSWIG